MTNKNKAYTNKYLQGKKNMVSLNYLMAETVGAEATVGIAYPEKKRSNGWAFGTRQAFPYYKHISRTIKK